MNNITIEFIQTWCLRFFFYLDTYVGSLWWAKYQWRLQWLIMACVMKNLPRLKHIRFKVDLKRGPFKTPLEESE